MNWAAFVFPFLGGLAVGFLLVDALYGSRVRQRRREREEDLRRWLSGR